MKYSIDELKTRFDAMGRDVDAFIRAYYPYYTAEHLAEVLGCNQRKVYNLAYAAEMRKHPDFKSVYHGPQIAKEGRRYRFPKGIVPHNKGKKMSPEVYERCAPTMFKKGIIPPNTKYDGCISWRRDTKSKRMYAYIRIRKQVWELYHRVLWEEANGPIPRGHVVAFRDGNTENCTLENLELISRGENALRNSMWNNYPEEVAKNMLLIGALNRRIRNMEKKETNKN